MRMDVLKNLDFRFPSSQVVFGVDAAGNLNDLLKDLSCTRILFVSDRGIIKAGILDKIVQRLKPTYQYSIFDEVEENPSVDCVNQCAKMGTEKKSDALVAVGGGSSIDTAKMGGVLITNKGAVGDYIGLDKIKVPPIPTVAIPTTAGTGSEISPFALITEKTTNLKLMIASRLLMPRIAVLDPTLLASLPADIAANTSMDAFAHNLEYFISKSAMPLSEAVNLQAIKMIADHIRRFVSHPSNLEAAGNMILASMMGEIGFSLSRLTMGHPMASPPSSHLHIPHGQAVAILLPRVLKFNMMSCPDKLAHVAELMGERVNELTLYEAAGKCVTAVEKLCWDIGIPSGFKDLGMKEEHIEIFTQDVMEAGMLGANPRRVTAKDVAEVYRMSL